MRSILLSFAALLVACTRAPVSQEIPSASVADSLIDSALDTRLYLRNQINLLDSARKADDYDALDSINNNIYRALEILAKDDAYQAVTVSQEDGISYLLSEDKKFCVVSWDRQTGGTMINFVAVAIYKTSAGTKVRYLGDDPKTEEIEGLQSYFTELYGLTGADSITTYFAYGLGQGSTMYPWRVLQAFRISADTLDQTQPTFDDRDNSILYDLSKFRSHNDIKEITFSSDHREIQVPEAEVPTGQYTRYRFADGMYRRVE